MDEGLRNTLKVQRAIRDLTQADLAVRAGVTRKSVNAIETGRMVPSVFLALKIARALEVSVETIFALDGGGSIPEGDRDRET
ncbi:MAG: helix-turn-helix transcriptional regulator [Acidobacteria bacterium]|nr:helix-turn-helix transcriptional regulator [Acidobacteriota bacterium]